MELTIDNVEERAARTSCCNRRPEIVLVRINTTAGKQIVYACPNCCVLSVVREGASLRDQLSALKDAEPDEAPNWYQAPEHFAWAAGYAAAMEKVRAILTTAKH